jgi:hypothetical protein
MLKVHARHDFSNDTINVFVREDALDGKCRVWTDNIVQDRERGMTYDPFLTDGKEFLQACCDAAWEAGIYPRQLADKTDELSATKRHLEDMRSLVFKTGLR